MPGHDIIDITHLSPMKLGAHAPLPATCSTEPSHGAAKPALQPCLLDMHKQPSC